jgi:uncharacterized membrane protein YeaQ/YmgE (transglycosylase-associated protein family)
MSLLALIVLGLAAGFAGSKLLNRTGEGLGLDIVLGAAGAIGAGLLFNLIEAPGANGLGIYSLIVAVIGSIVVLWAWHAFRAGGMKS